VNSSGAASCLCSDFTLEAIINIIIIIIIVTCF
jgi:hypothetical protein